MKSDVTNAVCVGCNIRFIFLKISTLEGKINELSLTTMNNGNNNTQDAATQSGADRRNDEIAVPLNDASSHAASVLGVSL